jgi:hypothetical protein
LKKNAAGLVLFVFAALILLPVVHSVNHFADESPVINHTLRADGDPLPPPIPPKPMPPGLAS